MDNQVLQVEVQKATILVVDGGAESRHRMARTLEHAGYEVREAGSGEDALRIASEGVDLVLMDVRTGDIDGYETIRRLKSDTRTAGTPVLLLDRATGASASRIKGLGVADGCLDAHAEPGELLATIESTLRRRRVDESLFEMRKMEAIGRLAGGLAHDFNNLLTVIVGYSKLSLEEVASDSPLADNLREIFQAGEECAQLTRQLLAFSRRQVSRPTEVVVEGMLRELSRSFRRVLGADIQLHLDLAGIEEPMVIDPAQLEQVVLMLAMNARDAITGAGHVTLKTEVVELDAEEVRFLNGLHPGRHFRLTVTDTGRGMDTATRSRVFEPFFTTKGLGRGTGLGLAAVLGIVQQNAGTVEVRSAPEQGTSFRIYLPLPVRRPAVRPPPGVTAPGPFTGTVLVVEDEPVVRSFARSVLVAKGFTVYTAVDGQDALEVFRAHRNEIDLVLSDVVMPQMDGMELAEALERLDPGVTVTLMSGHPSHGEAVPRAAMRSRTLLAKPFTHRQLLDHVCERLAARAAKNQN